jgi:hypothetical protein
MDCPDGIFPVTSASAFQEELALGLDDCSLTPASVPPVVETMAPPLKRKVLAGHWATSDNNVPMGGLGTVDTRGPVISRLPRMVGVAPGAPVAPVGPAGPVTPGAPSGPCSPLGPTGPRAPTAPGSGCLDSAHPATPALASEMTIALIVMAQSKVGAPLQRPFATTPPPRSCAPSPAATPRPPHGTTPGRRSNRPPGQKKRRRTAAIDVPAADVPQTGDLGRANQVVRHVCEGS